MYRASILILLLIALARAQIDPGHGEISGKPGVGPCNSGLSGPLGLREPVTLAAGQYPCTGAPYRVPLHHLPCHGNGCAWQRQVGAVTVTLRCYNQTTVSFADWYEPGVHLGQVTWDAVATAETAGAIVLTSYTLWLAAQPCTAGAVASHWATGAVQWCCDTVDAVASFSPVQASWSALQACSNAMWYIMVNRPTAAAWCVVHAVAAFSPVQWCYEVLHGAWSGHLRIMRFCADASRALAQRYARWLRHWQGAPPVMDLARLQHPRFACVPRARGDRLPAALLEADCLAGDACSLARSIAFDAIPYWPYAACVVVSGEERGRLELFCSDMTCTAYSLEFIPPAAPEPASRPAASTLVGDTGDRGSPGNPGFRGDPGLPGIGVHGAQGPPGQIGMTAANREVLQKTGE